MRLFGLVHCWLLPAVVVLAVPTMPRRLIGRSCSVTPLAPGTALTKCRRLNVRDGPWFSGRSDHPHRHSGWTYVGKTQNEHVRF